MPTARRSPVFWLARAAGVAAGSYLAHAAATWFRYGRVTPPSAAAADPLLDRFMPEYEAAERHHIYINAPADVVLAAAAEMDIQRSSIARGIFALREALIGSEVGAPLASGGLIAQTKAMGWGLLAEVPGREIVMGAVTRPWERRVVFRPVPPDAFSAFSEPYYVKIAWTLRADPLGPNESVFRTETRVTTTDAAARAKFRVYWSFFQPGIWLIRALTLRPLRADAERRFRRRRAPAHVKG